VVRILLILITCWVAAAPAQDAPGPARSPGAAEQEAKPAPVKKAEAEDEVPEKFDPSEEVPEDLATSFPVDI
jgi:hypothetical protein